MKITKEMLTADEGFVEGVVIEIEYWGCTKVVEYFESTYNYPQLDSIRPLTGPVAHWSLDMVPDDAEWSVMHPNGVDFFTADDWKALEGIVLDAPGAVSKRPWWCERKGK